VNPLLSRIISIAVTLLWGTTLISDADIQKLLDIRWWDWDLATLKKNISSLRSEEVQALWEKCYEGKKE